MIEQSLIKPNIEYPYMPPGRHLKYVSANHPFMLEAERAREECAGDPLFPVGIVLVKNGLVVARAGNGFNAGPQLHVCPRVVQEAPSGQGYDLCSLHDPAGHSEPSLMKVCKEVGIDPTGGDAYMYGHWWACEPCWHVLIENGVRDLYVTDDAHERFSRENVYAKTLSPSAKTVYVAGALTSLVGEEGELMRRFYEAMGAVCEDLGIKGYVPHLHSDPEKNPNMSAKEVWDVDTRLVRESDVIVAEVTNPALGTGGEIVLAQQHAKHIVLVSKKGVPVTRFVLGNPNVVYHVEYEDYDDACRQLRHVLRSI